MSVPPVLEKSNLVPLRASVMSPSACTPWLLTGLALMALNAYFPQLSPVSSLWSPLQAAVPVLHWTASWWFVLPGWESNLVSLAPLSHTSPLLNTEREILALTEEQNQNGFPQKLLSFLLKQAEPKSHEWCLSILDQAPNSFDDASTLIPLVTCQAPTTSSLID
ncbi:hypothetical protein DSO57_1023747 [Entomophthora muscae]|uniref:Uncharacterized protein n=1 Tax=Entomophthora muscae TaxID=34485 RepID=A0ACC2S5A2_9FUNG|nr:hypothetical protein DSO57_1023747 [Entomophthora muscae]